MPRIRFRAALILVVLLLTPHPRGLFADTPPDVSLTIAHINDVYEIDAVEGGRSGGLSRVATVLARLRAGGTPVITTLGGDFLSPSALGTARVDGEPLAGRQMVDVLDAMGLQWATLGNHEFDVSEAAFKARLAQARFRTVVSNVTDAAGQPFAHTAPSAIATVRVSGRVLRIGFIGLTIDSNRKDWVRFSDPIQAARAQVAALGTRLDAIVALTHLSLATDQQLAEAVPELDLILGGHEHENWELRRGPRFTPIVKADSNVRSMAVVTLRFGRPGTPPAITSRLQPIDTRVPKQARVEASVRRWVSAAFDAFRRDGFTPERVIATTSEPLDGRESVVRNRPGALTELILSGIAREAAPVDVAIVNGGSIRIDDVVPPGPITEYDTIRMLPFGGRILKASFDGALLASVLDIGASNGGTGGYMHLRGATRGDGGWQIGGRPLDPAARYTVALPEYLLTGGEVRLGFLTRANTQVHDVRELRDIRLTLIDALREPASVQRAR